MPHPQDFYYQEKSSDPEFSNTPQGGAPNVGRLINGRPPWKKHSSVQEKPKSLILADWTASNWSERKIKEVKAKIDQLITDGFTVYWWQGDRIDLLTKKSLLFLDRKICRRAMAPVSPEHLMTAARADHNNLTKANTLILDNFILDGVLQNKALAVRGLDVGDLTADTNSYIINSSPSAALIPQIMPNSWVNLDLVCKNLKHANPPLTHIIHSEFSALANKAKEAVATHFPHLPVHTRYRKLTLTPFMTGILLEYKKVSIAGAIIHLEQLAEIVELTLIGTFTSSDTQRLFDKMPSLKKLNLESLSIKSSGDKITLPPQLERMDINLGEGSYSKSPIEQYKTLFFELFNKSSSLKSLSFLYIFDDVIQHAYKKIKEQIDFISEEQSKDLLAGDDKDSSNGLLLDIFLNHSAYEELRGINTTCAIPISMEALAKKKLYLKVKQEWISFAEAVAIHFNKPTYLSDQSLAKKQPEVIPAAPVHNPASFRTYGSKANTPFQFNNKNKTLNQGMVIEKLSQYLTLTNQHRAFIPKIQDGVCHALSHHFVTMTLDKWNDLMRTIQQWDGNEDSLNQELKSVFDDIFKLVQKFYFSETRIDNTYLGDNCRSFLEQLHTPLILSSPWHAIAVTYSATDKTWTVYDPNFSTPPQKKANVNDLEALIKQSLGALIFVDDAYNQPSLIKHPHDFLRDGGLLALVITSDVKPMLNQLPPNIQYTKEALDGLLLRDTSGKPAWIQGIKHAECRPFTLMVLGQFIKTNPDYMLQLQKSMEAMSYYERHEGVVLLSQLIPGNTDKAILGELVTSLRTALHKDYRSQLETWDKKKDTTLELPVYCQKLVKKNSEVRRLIECDSSESVKALSLQVLKHCLAVSRPVFYINSPDDLICSASWVRSTTGSNVGTIKKGPGGPLHEFLTQNEGKNPVLLINYDNFKADDIVRFNSLLDKERMADGTPLPSDTVVLGFINPHKPSSYKGEDFYSRFDSKEICPIPAETLQFSLPAEPKITNTTDNDVTSINLGNADDWEERLLGRWVIKKDRLVFEEGELERALRTHKSIQIQNGPWDNPRFQFLWQQAMLRGQITRDGRTIKIPKHIVWSQRQGYDWGRLASNITFNEVPGTNRVILNSRLLSSFFNQYVCEEASAQLNSIPGLLKQHKNSTLNIYITRTLSFDEWGLLLSDCEKYGVTLSCKLAPGITLPPALAEKAVIPKQKAASTWNVGQKDDPLVITSSDPATTIIQLTHKDADWMVIDISECETSTLINSIDGRLNPDGLGFSFHKKIGALEKGLAENKKILLHGNFSPDMMDGLAPLLLNPRTKGRLVLVGGKAEPFNYCSIAHHQVSDAEKQTCLETVLKATAAEVASLKAHFQTDSYPVLRARLVRQRAFPHLKKIDPWQGLLQAEPIVVTGFDAAHSKEKAEAFVDKRVQGVKAVLTHSPYVYLTGPTAVGKSTFVEKTFANLPGVTLYSGESRMKEWALDHSEGMKVLFIDEVNVTRRQWLEMEGLFNTPPGLLINGIYYPLTASHKVIFAGNPLTYGGERQKSPLFERHGNALLFEPLSPEFIYEYLLKPVFSGTSLDSQSLELVAPMLDVYRFISQQTQKDVLISPRELQMMALMVVSYAKSHPKATSEDYLVAARTYAYRLGLHLNTENNKTAFVAQFKPGHMLPYDQLSEHKTEFLVTPSRQEIRQQLKDLLDLRQFRQKAPNEAQQYGGLGGIVLDGEPGIGKSELVLSELLARGYQEVHDIYGEPNLSTPENTFYRMPVSMQNSDKEALLLKAFHEGAVVIVDEINSSPMMERLLNSLLMGLTPEQKRPKKPGFLIIGTQNPVSMDGRLAPSTALARRLITTPLPAYEVKEMQDILINKGVDAKESAIMVQDYLYNREKAQKEHLKPKPIFRDLLRLAEKISFIFSNKMVSLNEQIEKLRTYGKKLMKDDPVEGNKTIQWADKLQFIAEQFHQLQTTTDQQKKCRRDFSDALKHSYKALGTHRASWKPILANILIAATGIGLLVIMKNYYDTGRVFFSETSRQEKLRQMQESFGDEGIKKEQSSSKPLF